MACSLQGILYLRALSCRCKLFSWHLTSAVRAQNYLEMLFLGEDSLTIRALEVRFRRGIAICHHVQHMVSCDLARVVEANVGIVGCTAQDPLA
jgi:hypothetical protein